MLGHAINVKGVGDEAARRFVARRMSDLRRVYEAEKARVGELRRPIAHSTEVAAAEEQVRKSEAATEAAKVAFEKATAKLTAVEAGAPRGWRRWIAWLTGQSRHYEERRVRAVAALELKSQHLRAQAIIAHGHRLTYEKVVKQDKIRRATETADRREQEREALAKMEQVRLAADALRRVPSMASQSLDDLLRFGEAERRRRLSAAEEKEAKIAASSRLSAPRPRLF
ncbi:hypothetical protein [Methylosinus sp. KRF6]|uniref:hypothetical protein n=1 Tax=Methylosinus sp. KRF6 TaxID=2846853 RepID=UPI001C0DAB48|nr:hypothetical protein [Methylosinus sp. KRF6]MBU3888584.1 hypothetical protein [Methylosinus sp. KRF6]